MLKLPPMPLALLLVLAACSSGGGASSTTTTALPAEPTSSQTSTTTSTVTTTTTGLVTTTTVLASDPLGLITQTGVPVAIVETNDGEYLVTTPCGNTATLSHGSPIGAVDVVVDPGHGGPIDTGAVAPTGMPEKELNLQVAQLMRSLLAVRGITAVLTRTADYPTPLSVRANLADQLEATLMVSIHHNAPTPGPSPVPGVEVFFQDGSDASKRLGGLLWESGMSSLSVFDVAWVGAEDAGAMTVLNSRGDDAYGILRTPRTPTALIELGFVSSRPEAELHLDPNYVVVAARALTDAVERYLTTEEIGSGFVEGRIFNPSPGVGKDVCVDPDLE